MYILHILKYHIYIHILYFSLPNPLELKHSNDEKQITHN